jgi:hypothetical protein
MNSDTQVTITLSLAVGIVVGIWRIATKFERFRREHMELQAKVGTMWEFHLRRGKAEAIETGIVRHDYAHEHGDEEFVLTPNVRDAFRHNGLDRRIQEWAVREAANLNEHDLTIAIEKAFGDDLLNQICIPLGIRAGGCLYAAAIIARKHETLVARDRQGQ